MHSDSSPDAIDLRYVLIATTNWRGLSRMHFDLAPLLEFGLTSHVRYSMLHEPGRHARRDAQLKPHQWDKMLPWEEAIQSHPDLVITDAPLHDLQHFADRLVVIPHGADHLQDWRALPEHTPRLWTDEAIQPLAYAAAGAASRRRLLKHYPAARDRVHFVGDLGLERLQQSTVCREEYRRHLGIGDRCLVLIASHWDDESVIATDPSLAARLNRELPCDDYVVAIAQDTPARDGFGKINRLGEMACFRNGLIMPAPDDSWRSLLLASDVVIGDHGDYTLYAAALDTPLLVAAHEYSTVSDEALIELYRSTPRLDTSSDVKTQVDLAIARHTVDKYRQWSDDVVVAPDIPPSHALRDILAHLDVISPRNSWWRPELLPNPELDEICKPETAWWCCISINDDHDIVEWHNYRRPKLPTSPNTGGIGHPVADLSTRTVEWREASAVVLHHTETFLPWEAEIEVKRIFEAYPCGPALVSIRLTGTSSLIATAPKPANYSAEEEWYPNYRLYATVEEGPLAALVLAAAPSAIYDWITSRELPIPDSLTFKKGARSCTVSFMPSTH